MMSRHPTWLRADPESLRPGSIFDASAVNTRELVLSDSPGRSNGAQAQTLLIHKLLHQQWLHASWHLKIDTQRACQTEWISASGTWRTTWPLESTCIYIHLGSHSDF